MENCKKHSAPVPEGMTAEQYRFMAHGMRKDEVLNHQADGHGSGGEGTLKVPTGMSETNPFKSDKQRKFLAINKPEIAHKFAMHSKKKK